MIGEDFSDDLILASERALDFSLFVGDLIW
jgi:hypothetical protein